MLLGDELGHGDQAELGDVVGPVAGVRHQSADRHVVDDHAPAGLDHGGEGQQRHPSRSHDVDLPRQVPLLLGLVHERAHPGGGPRVVEQDVQRTKFPKRALDHGLGLCLVGHVERGREAPDPEAVAQLGGQRLEFGHVVTQAVSGVLAQLRAVAAQVGHHHIGPGLSQATGRGRAHPTGAARAGYQRHATPQHRGHETAPLSGTSTARRDMTATLNPAQMPSWQPTSEPVSGALASLTRKWKTGAISGAGR